MKSKPSKIILTSLVLLLSAQVTFAQGFVFCGRRGQNDPCEVSDLFVLVYYTVNFLIGMAGLVSLFYVVWGGMRMMFSNGNPANIQEGKDTIRNSLVGLILVFLSYLIVGYVAQMLLPGTGGSSDPLRNLIDYIGR
jgi:hypothetical protein